MTEGFESFDPMVQQIATEFGNKFRTYGADRDDFLQEMYLWLFENARVVEAWHDRDRYSEKDTTRLLAKSLRNECSDYGLDIKSQALGYERNDLYFYSKGEVRALLPAVFNEDAWQEPPQSEGRSTKAPSEGGNWVCTLADVSRAYKQLDRYDQDVLHAIHGSGWTNKMLAEAYDVSEQTMSYHHDRAIGRLVALLGGSTPDPMRTQTGKDPWRGRRAVSNATARAYTSREYDE